jgi:hypothetical protein
MGMELNCSVQVSGVMTMTWSNVVILWAGATTTVRQQDIFSSMMHPIGDVRARIARTSTYTNVPQRQACAVLTIAQSMHSMSYDMMLTEFYVKIWIVK